MVSSMIVKCSFMILISVFIMKSINCISNVCKCIDDVLHHSFLRGIIRDRIKKDNTNNTNKNNT